MTIYKVDNCKDVFGISIGIITDYTPIQKEKYVPKAVFDKQGMASCAVGTAACAGASTAVFAGAKHGTKIGLISGLVSAAVGGAIGGVSALHQAVNHERVFYVTIRNLSRRKYVYRHGYNDSGNISVPTAIPAGSTARLAFHNDGSFSGAVCFASKVDYLYIGSSNPMVGKNKLRVECTDYDYDIYTYWNDMGYWKITENCGNNVFLSKAVYENPGQCYLDIYDDENPGGGGKADF